MRCWWFLSSGVGEGSEGRNALREATETRDKNWRDKPHSLVSGLTVNIKVYISQRSVALFL